MIWAVLLGGVILGFIFGMYFGIHVANRDSGNRIEEAEKTIQELLDLRDTLHEELDKEQLRFINYKKDSVKLFNEESQRAEKMHRTGWEQGRNSAYSEMAETVKNWQLASKDLPVNGT